MDKALTSVFIFFALIGPMVSTALIPKTFDDVLLIPKTLNEGNGFQSAGMRGCQGGSPTTTTTTATSG